MSDKICYVCQSSNNKQDSSYDIASILNYSEQN